MRRPGLLVALSAFVLTSGFVRPALAVDKVTCMSAAESSEDLRKAGKLRDARDKLAVCAQSACPAFVRNDCKKWLGEVTAAVPSLAIRVQDAQGNAVTNVVVTADGVNVADTVRATPPWTVVELDPGPRALRFTHGDQVVDRSVTVKEGEKLRELTVQLTPEVVPTAPAAPPPVPEASPSRPVPISVFVLGGAGLVSAGVGAFFQVSGMSKVSALGGCKPSCTTSSRDDARTNLWIGNVGLGVGAVALATAAVLFLRRPEVPTRVGWLHLHVDVGPTRDGLVGLLSGTLE
jgi:hypothetical protein